MASFSRSNSEEQNLKLEQRAVLFKSWVFITPRNRFQKSGDHFIYDICGLNILLIMQKDGETIKGFHNVCRHRGYPVRVKDGLAKFLGCGYQDWSYNPDDSLHKAPQSEDVPCVDKTSNALWPLNLYITSSGLVFVNLERKQPSISFEDYYGPDLEARLSSLPLADGVFFRRVEKRLAVNWKAIANAYIYGSSEDSGWLSTALELESARLGFFATGSVLLHPEGFVYIHFYPIDTNKTQYNAHYYSKPGATESERKNLLQALQTMEIKELEVGPVFGHRRGGCWEMVDAMMAQHAEAERRAKGILSTVEMRSSEEGSGKTIHFVVN